MTGGPLDRMAKLNSFTATLLIAGIFAALLFFYLVTDYLPLLALVVAVPLTGDFLLRMHPQARFHGPAATALYLLVPVLYALGAALYLGDVASGAWDLPAALGAGLFFGITLNAEYLTVDPNAETYEPARFVLLLTGYIVALAIFFVAFSESVPLAVGVVFVAVAAFGLTADMLRELEEGNTALFIQAGAVALVMAQARLALYFIDLADPRLASPFLWIAFYAMTGVVQNQVSGRLDRQTLRQYGVVAGVGLAMILIVRLFFH